jgi:hypothetical protein
MNGAYSIVFVISIFVSSDIVIAGLHRLAAVLLPRYYPGTYLDRMEWLLPEVVMLARA